MDPMSASHITIPASGVASRNQDADNADTSSTKTEVEEMELDQLSDPEDNVSKIVCYEFSKVGKVVVPIFKDFYVPKLKSDFGIVDLTHYLQCSQLLRAQNSQFYSDL